MIRVYWFVCVALLGDLGGFGLLCGCVGFWVVLLFVEVGLIFG